MTKIIPQIDETAGELPPILPNNPQTDREKLWAMLNRAHALSDRVSARICQRIQTRTGLKKLDELFTLSERSYKLFCRVQARYEATQSQFVRDLRND